MNQKIVAVFAIIVIACIAIVAVQVFVKSSEPSTVGSLNNTQKALAVLASLQTGTRLPLRIMSVRIPISSTTLHSPMDEMLFLMFLIL